jgi:exosortase/archaeosortase family protein
VPTDMGRSRTDALRFALRAFLWSVGFFGLLRLHWIEAQVVLPFTRAQAAAAEGLFGAAASPVVVTLACSGTDALALCLGAILAYPVTWPRRLAGAGAGAVLIVGLNTIRIGTLGRAAAAPAWFDALHVYVWPAVLTLAIAGYVFAWMRLADRRHTPSAGESTPHESVARVGPQPSRRFVVLTVAFLLLFSIASPLYLESPTVLALAGFIARAAAGILGVLGVSAHAAANVLWTPRGGFAVTQECISTPLIPVYLAGVCTCAGTWRRLAVGIAAAAPLFIALGIARLLVVALPAALVASPLFFVHAFYQLILAAVLVVLAALWRHGRRASLGYAMVGIIVGVVFVLLLGPVYTRAVTSPAGIPLDDPQGAIALLPAFQVGLFLALWIAAYSAAGWKRFVAGLAVLSLTQMTGLLALHVLASHVHQTARVTDIRGWAVAGPLLIVAMVVHAARPHR